MKGAELKRIRAARGLSLRDVAGRAGVSHGAVVKVESGVGNPSLAMLEALSRALGVRFVIAHGISDVEVDGDAPVVNVNAEVDELKGASNG